MSRIEALETGDGAGVSLDAAQGEQETLLLARLRAEIQIGLDDIAAGRVVDAETAFAEARRVIAAGSTGH